jgi:endonuclease/exonuclease/phosphatase family metal-dependent hydrolase
VLREIDADIVALQEVDMDLRDGGQGLARLTRDTRYHGIPGVTMLRGDAHYGNAILARSRPLAVRRHDLSVPGREPRGAIDIDLSWQHCRVRFVATHLGLRPGERRLQVRRLLPTLSGDGYDLLILAGDLNEWFLLGRPLRMLQRKFSETPHRRTWPSRRPVFSLDRIWVQPRSALQSLTTHQSPLAGLASDHLPLVAELKTGVSGE